ncbi:hypothetical protein ARMSODRAFT_310618 [Armillaria solidipes]|uniref:Uncharacterized protein n=1 Tax=Armillaria solidipes TaxID=1076256 RepID=A0A2H3BN61_9AGAR|nr:hypothetical protein ARMSODRAFT_310618 [Armillaria solidipes]
MTKICTDSRHHHTTPPLSLSIAPPTLLNCPTLASPTFPSFFFVFISYLVSIFLRPPPSSYRTLPHPCIVSVISLSLFLFFISLNAYLPSCLTNRAKSFFFLVLVGLLN